MYNKHQFQLLHLLMYLHMKLLELLDIFFLNFLHQSPVIDDDNEQPAFISGNKTFLLGLINFAVSAIK